jgi:membrane fusion protein, heavy metal efflux system
MRFPGTPTSRILVGLLLLAALAAIAVWWTQGFSKEASRKPAAPARQSLAEAASQSIELSPRVVKLGGIKTTIISEPTQSRLLELRGELAIDTGRLAHVHSRFPGEIVQLGQVDEPAVPSAGTPTTKRSLRVTDRVTKGQRLAVLFSKDLGEKKSELVDAQANLNLDEIRLERLKALVEKGAIAEGSVREAERAVEKGLIAVAKAERTLRSYSLDEEEIAHIKAEAERIHKRKREDRDQDRDWARVDIVAPIDGTIMEQNAIKGDIVDTALDLFQVADLSVLNVWLHAYEEDLPYLQRLPQPIHAELHLPANPDLGPIKATIDRIGGIIDPNEHMALLVGSVENPKGTLKASQFAPATIDLGVEPNVVEIPATALVDDGNDSYVFIQADPEVFRFTCRKVEVERRYRDFVYVSSHLSEAQRKQGLQELHVGEIVVSRGAVELKEDLSQQQAARGSQ